jgi:hypothetical protein
MRPGEEGSGMTIEGTQVLAASSEERGTWPTGRSLLLAVLPLVAYLAILMAIEGRPQLILPDAQVVWFVLGPLVLVYPVVAAIARVNAYAPTTVLVVASVAPAIALAARLLVDPIARDPKGNAVLDVAVLQARALPPAILAVAAFVAIEIASAGMRRGVVLGILASLVAMGVAAAAAVAILQLIGTGLPSLS